MTIGISAPTGRRPRARCATEGGGRAGGKLNQAPTAPQMRPDGRKPRIIDRVNDTIVKAN